MIFFFSAQALQDIGQLKWAKTMPIAWLLPYDGKKALKKTIQNI